MGNTVGSLSEVQHAIVIGSVLGDGAMRCKTNALLEINHSSHQQSYGRLEVSTSRRSGANATKGSPEQRKANRVPIRHPFAPAADSVLPAVLRNRPEADTGADAFRAQPGGVVHGRRLSLEERGVSEHAAVRRDEPANVASAPPRTVGDRGDAQPRQVLLPSTNFGSRDPSVGQAHRAVSVG